MNRMYKSYKSFHFIAVHHVSTHVMSHVACRMSAACLPLVLSPVGPTDFQLPIYPPDNLPTDPTKQPASQPAGKYLPCLPEPRFHGWVDVLVASGRTGAWDGRLARYAETREEAGEGTDRVENFVG